MGLSIVQRIIAGFVLMLLLLVLLGFISILKIRGINEGLSQIAADLELADAPPTAAQRAALGLLRSALDACEQEWRRLSAGELAELERKLGPAPGR